MYDFVNKRVGKQQIQFLCCFLVVLLAVNGCGIYTFSGNVPGHLKSVAIPDFENQTAEYGVEEMLTDELLNAFRNDNSLKIRDLDEADSVIRGVIVNIDDQPATFSSDAVVDEYKITVTVAVEFYDRIQDKVVWEERLSNYGMYPFSSGASAERDEGLEEAVGKLAEDILNKTVSGW